MRSLTAALVSVIFGAILSVPTASAAGTVPVEVVTTTAADQHGDPELHCEGFAPDEPTCIGTFTVPDVDRFGIRIAVDPNVGYSGTIEVLARSSTSATFITCDILLTAECVFQQAGFYVVGQPVTLVGVASGFGAWIIEAPVRVS